MIRISARTLLALIPLAALPPTAPLFGRSAPPRVVPRALDGYIITQKLTSDAPQAPALTMRVKVAQGRIRLEMESPDLAQLGGMYLLVGDSGKVISVMSQMGMAMKMDASAISSMNGMGGAMASLPSVSDVTFSVEDLGAGEAMFGVPTHKYRYNVKYSTSSQARGALKSQTTMDMWVAPNLPGLSDGFQKFADTFGSAFSGLAGGGSQALAAEMKAKVPKGYAMKAIIKTVETDASGRPENSTSTLEVTDYAKMSIEPSDFEVPAGMQVMDMAQMFRGRGGEN